MSIVRTLTTLLDFKEDTSGLKRYESGINRVKSTVLSAAAGLAAGTAAMFTMEKIGQFIVGLSNAGQEINKLHSQINELLRPSDDLATIQDGLVRTAQTVGQAYTDVAKTFKGFLNDSQEVNISQKDLLASTENIYKTLTLSKTTTEETNQLMEVLSRSSRAGKMSPRMLATMNDISPETYKALRENLGVTSDQLAEMAKDGKLTSEVILKAFAKTNTELTRRFEAVPKSLGFAFNYAYNQMALAMAYIWKVADVTKYLARIIIWLTDTIVKFTQSLIRYFGGLGNILRVLGIALSIVFGPWLIRQLALATLGMVKFAAATLAATWPWLAIGAAIMVAALAIEDFIGWIQGKDSLIGRAIGPFEDLKKAFLDSDFVKFFTKVVDVFSMSFTEAWEKVRELLFQLGRDLGINFEGAWNAIAGVISSVATILTDAFNAAWGVIKPILDSMAEAVRTGFTAAVEFASRVINGEFVGGLNVIKEVLEVIKIAFIGVGRIITDTIIAGIDAAKLAIKAVSQLIAGDFTGAWETAKQLFQSLLDILTNNFVTVWDTIKAAAEPVTKILEVFAGWIKDIATYFGLWNDLSFEKLTRSIQAVSDMVTTLIGYVKSAWDLVSNAPSIVGDAVTGARDRVVAGAGAVGGAVAGAAGSVGGAIVDAGAAVGGAASRAVTGARSLLGFGPATPPPGEQPAPGAQVVPIMPSIPPGGMPSNVMPANPLELMLPEATPTAAPISIAPSIVQHNNITVQALSPDGAEIAGAVRREMDRAGASAADVTARSIQAATPRVEAATQ